MATILNFTNYAFMSLDNKMAQKPEAVWEMLRSLKEKSKPVGTKEFDTLRVKVI